MGAAEYIKAFKVASSLDGISYITYKSDSIRRDKVRRYTVINNVVMAYFSETAIFSSVYSPLVCVLQVFVGNIDNDSTKTNLFEPPIVAQYIRIIPVVCRRACTLRLELVGCELNGKHKENTPYSFNAHRKF